MQMLLRQNAFESARPELFRTGFFYHAGGSVSNSVSGVSLQTS